METPQCDGDDDGILLHSAMNLDVIVVITLAITMIVVP